MSETLSIEIDGKACACEPGELLYDIATRNGIFIPTLCRSDDYPLRSCCRICIVEVEQDGRRKVVPSCSYEVTCPCQVFTQSERITEERAVILGLLHHRAPEAATISFMNGQMGDEALELPATLDTEKCIMCGRCVQACDELGASAISMIGKGTDARIAPPFEMAPKPCIGCLNCAKECPAEAIPYREDEFARSIWGRTFTLVYCEKCGAPIGTAAMFAHASHTAGPLSHLCENCQS